MYVFKRRDSYVGVVILMSKEINWGVWKRLNYWGMLQTNECHGDSLDCMLFVASFWFDAVGEERCRWAELSSGK